MVNLTINEHSSDKYTPRTYLNAKTADLTAAFAIDFTTAGEKCTHKAAADRYVPLSILKPPIVCARELYKVCKRLDVKILNVAGNGIYTLTRHKWSQNDVNNYVVAVLSLVHQHHPLDKIISGGQSGLDIAGGVAGVYLGIETVLTLPKGFIQRFEDKVDKSFSRDYIEKQVLEGVRLLNY